MRQTRRWNRVPCCAAAETSVQYDSNVDDA
jgi:hypothetical protein